MVKHLSGPSVANLTGTLPSTLRRLVQRTAISLGRAFVNPALSAKPAGSQTRSKYNISMKEIIQQRIVALSKEVEALHNEREAMFQRDKEIDVRLHQLVGAIYEMQQLIATQLLYRYCA